VGAAAIPLPWLCRGSCMLMPPRPPPARARRRSQPEGQVMKALGRELSAAAAKMLIQAHPRPLLAEDHPRSGRGLTVFSPGPPRNGWSTAGAAARLDSSSATSRRRRECTVGTRVGAAVGRGGGGGGLFSTGKGREGRGTRAERATRGGEERATRGGIRTRVAALVKHRGCRRKGHVAQRVRLVRGEGRGVSDLYEGDRARALAGARVSRARGRAGPLRVRARRELRAPRRAPRAHVRPAPRGARPARGGC
jgi:hypothetical protein